MKTITFDGDSYLLGLPSVLHFFAIENAKMKDHFVTHHNYPSCFAFDVSNRKDISDERFSPLGEATKCLLHTRFVLEDRDHSYSFSQVITSIDAKSSTLMLDPTSRLGFSDAYQKSIGYRPLLIPLDKNGNISQELCVNPNGSLMLGGTISMDGKKRAVKTTGQLKKINQSFSIVDSVKNPIEWICWDGCLISKHILGITSIVDLEKMGFLCWSDIPVYKSMLNRGVYSHVE